MATDIPDNLLATITSAMQQDSIKEFYIEERLFVAEYINHDAIADFSLARCRVEPGVTTQLHSLAVTEWYVIERGHGQMTLGEKQQIIGAGSVVQIPVGTKQQIENLGAEDLIFFCVCRPRFTPDSYLSHE